MRDDDLDFTIARLGECRFESPMSGVRFRRDDERVLYHSTLERINAWLDKGAAPPAMESAGPRRMLFVDPAKLACGIVTCGEVLLPGGSATSSGQAPTGWTGSGGVGYRSCGAASPRDRRPAARLSGVPRVSTGCSGARATFAR